jgi:hypothetical protein
MTRIHGYSEWLLELVWNWFRTHLKWFWLFLQKFRTISQSLELIWSKFPYWYDTSWSRFGTKFGNHFGAEFRTDLSFNSENLFQISIRHSYRTCSGRCVGNISWNQCLELTWNLFVGSESTTSNEIWKILNFMFGTGRTNGAFGSWLNRDQPFCVTSQIRNEPTEHEF